MLRRLVLLASAFSVATLAQARPMDGAPQTGAQPVVIPSEPTTLMGRQYQVAKREPIILMDPALERMSSEQKYHRASTSPSHPPVVEPKILRKRVEPFPRYILERSLDSLQVREIHTPTHTAAKQPPPNKFSEPPPPAPVPPHATSDFITNEQKDDVHSKHGDSTRVSNTDRHREAFSQSSGLGHGSGLGVAGLGLGGGSEPGIAGLGSGGSGTSGGSGLSALGGLISG
ncbi:hypothetical protein BC835DRAFT_1418228 [Cytidiella melzeri]|nr:hypothetical protein BC835DRAFT_1418228 [Cytidiella melzeri]